MQFRILRYVEKPLQRAKHFIIVTLTFQIYYSNDVFQLKWSTMQNQLGKSKLIVLKNAKNWASTKQDIW